jgi:hypothetical protein
MTGSVEIHLLEINGSEKQKKKEWIYYSNSIYGIDLIGELKSKKPKGTKSIRVRKQCIYTCFFLVLVG